MLSSTVGGLGEYLINSNSENYSNPDRILNSKKRQYFSILDKGADTLSRKLTVLIKANYSRINSGAAVCKI